MTVQHLQDAMIELFLSEFWYLTQSREVAFGVAKFGKRYLVDLAAHVDNE